MSRDNHMQILEMYKDSNNSGITITKVYLLVMKGVKRHDSYFLNGVIVPPTHAAIVGKCKTDSKLLHARMGHISEQVLVELSKQGLIMNYTHANLPFCEIRVQGKQHIIKFS